MRRTENNKTLIQIAAMKSRFPQFKAKRRAGGIVEFTGTLQVKPIFPVYTIAVTYGGDARPLIRVLEPALVADPPHYFKENNSLCLYKWENYKWTGEKLIARDIVPWAAAWIYFYETWLQKNKWYGPEAGHPDSNLF
jgi:hypothetical protein